MPHSMASDYSSSQEEDDDVLPDAPAANPVDTTMAEDNEMRGDVVADAVEGKMNLEKMDVKLQDLFNDMDDEDEEFPSSMVDAKVKVESSPPAAPR